MSRGNPVLSVRIPRDLVAEVEALIARRNLWSSREPWDVAGFIRDAIREKIAKHERGRKPHKGRSKESPPIGEQDQILLDAIAAESEQPSGSFTIGTFPLTDAEHNLARSFSRGFGN